MLASNRQSWSLVLLLVGAILLIVIGPFVFVRNAHEMATQAADAVSHSARVEASVQALMYDLRNRESASLAYAVGHDTQAIRERLTESQREIPKDLERLRMLTRDNPEQQVQVGRMSALIDQRSAISAEILSKPAGQAEPHEIQWLLDRNPLRQIGNRVSVNEHALMQRHITRSKELEKRSDLVTWLAAATRSSCFPAWRCCCAGCWTAGASPKRIRNVPAHARKPCCRRFANPSWCWTRTSGW